MLVYNIHIQYILYIIHINDVLHTHTYYIYILHTILHIMYILRKQVCGPGVFRQFRLEQNDKIFGMEPFICAENWRRCAEKRS